MFEGWDVVVGLWPGETVETLAVDDRLGFEVTCQELADGWSGGSSRVA